MVMRSADLNHYRFDLSSKLDGSALLCDKCAERVKRTIPSLIKVNGEVKKWQCCEECKAITKEARAELDDRQFTRDFNRAWNELELWRNP